MHSYANGGYQNDYKIEENYNTKPNYAQLKSGSKYCGNQMRR